MIELLSVIFSSFLIFYSRCIFGTLFLKLIKSLTRVLGEVSEFTNMGVYLRYVFRLVFCTFYIFLLFILLISPLIVFIYDIESNITNILFLISSVLCLYLLLNYLNKNLFFYSKVPFLERVILLFFYWDLRWAIKLSSFSKSTTKQESRYNLNSSIFIISVARSATSALSTLMAKKEDFFSLQYMHLPFSLTPEWASRFQSKKNVTSNRLHLDNRTQDLYSCDSLDEPMMRYLDYFINDDDYLNSLLEWHARLSLLSDKSNLILKNNNNYLRLRRLVNMPSAIFLVPFRDPFVTANSLLTNHLHFKKISKNDSFFVDYLRLLRHLEFGPLHDTTYHKSINWNLDIDSFEYWLRTWVNFAENVLHYYRLYPNKFIFFFTGSEITDNSVDILCDVISHNNIHNSVDTELSIGEYHSDPDQSDDFFMYSKHLYKQLRSLAINV